MSTVARRPWLRFGAVMLVAIALHLIYATFMSGWAVVPMEHARVEVAGQIFQSVDVNEPAQVAFKGAFHRAVRPVVMRVMFYDFLFSLLVVACCVYIYSDKSKGGS
jgi:hypothetical protein